MPLSATETAGRADIEVHSAHQRLTLISGAGVSPAPFFTQQQQQLHSSHALSRPTPQRTPAVRREQATSLRPPDRAPLQACLAAA